MIMLRKRPALRHRVRRKRDTMKMIVRTPQHKRRDSIMKGTARFPRIHFARNCAFAFLLPALLLAGCDTTAGQETESPPVNAVESGESGGNNTAAVEPGEGHLGEETLTAFLDRDGSDGYTGDYVLVYRPALEGGSKPMGTLDGLVETAPNQVPSHEGTYLQTTGIYSEEDPYLTDEIRQTDLCYDLTDGDLWQVGFQRVFYMGFDFPEEMLFEVSAVGDRCRVWSPVNPAYGPLEDIDPSYPEQLAREMDTAIPVLEQSFGAIPDIRGDGKMNILCFDFDLPTALGVTFPSDIYDEISLNGQMRRGNSLPIVHINTAPLIQGTYSKLSEIYTCVVHEMQHSIFGGREREQDIGNGSIAMGNGKLFLTEFLSVAAQEIVYPGSSICEYLPWWYSNKAVWEDLLADNADVYLRSKDGQRQSGQSMFFWGAAREDYGAVLLLAHFVENRGGRDAFMRIAEFGYTDMSDMMSRMWEGLGYEDYPTFMEDFLLSILLHEEDGPYQLHPFKGYDPALCGGVEAPFSYLVPIITDKGLYVKAGGYAVLRPVGGVYYPPVTASSGLRYVGITLKETK